MDLVPVFVTVREKTAEIELGTELQNGCLRLLEPDAI